jgi:hypothetical protein
MQVPWIVWGFFKLITPFIDPVTREKLKFNEDMKQYVPPEQLWSADWGGDMDFDYDHDAYWPALNDMCRQRREERMRRWEAAGKVVGESEVYLTGGMDVSVNGFKYGSSEVEANGNGVVKGGEKEEKDDKKNGDVAEVEGKMAETTLHDTKGDAVNGDAPAAAGTEEKKAE